MNRFFSGALTALSAVAVLFFFRFWQRTRDQLFGFFAAGFGVLALHWAALGLLNPGDDTRHYVYLVRFVAFALIIGGVVQKNRSSRPRR